MTTEVPTEYLTYDDDKCMGQVAPSTELADFISYPDMEQYRKDLHPGKVNVVHFMCKFEKGAYNCNEEMSQIKEKYGDRVQVVGLSTDPDRGTVEKWLEKSKKGQVTDLNTGKPYRLEMDVAWDDGKKTFGMYRALCGGKLTTYHAFIVNLEGKIVWHQQFTQTSPPSKACFQQQLEAVLEGKPLLSNGNRPVIEADAEEEAADDMGDGLW
eukprot:TRINITY_DN963_c0_g1_i3.p2 TRINITY_DN963_c0_g1~~TRINITY_DN963_c0_g1_i3.p2  ORF type:complete len:211 (+),score=103.06 TRINITY_DN963_c0_g1_i3:79-711(+)